MVWLQTAQTFLSLLYFLYLACHLFFEIIYTSAYADFFYSAIGKGTPWISRICKHFGEPISKSWHT